MIHAFIVCSTVQPCSGPLPLFVISSLMDVQLFIDLYFLRYTMMSMKWYHWTFIFKSNLMVHTLLRKARNTLVCLPREANALPQPSHRSRTQVGQQKSTVLTPLGYHLVLSELSYGIDFSGFSLFTVLELVWISWWLVHNIIVIFVLIKIILQVFRWYCV